MIENRMVIDSEWEWRENKRKVVYECDCCGADIYEGDDYYEIEEKRYCEPCIDFRKETA